MNVNFISIALDPGVRDMHERRFAAACHYVTKLFDVEKPKVSATSDIGIYNADRMGGTWRPSSWISAGEEIISFSQPPIPVDEEVTLDRYADHVADLVATRAFDSLLPNYFGLHKRSDESVTVWADTLGLGRCYYVWNDRFFAASNHIGVLSFFLDGEVEVDEGAVAKFASGGWFMEDDSPYKGIKRLRESSQIDITADKRVKISEYGDFASLVSTREAEPDYEAAVAQLSTAAANLGHLSVGIPSVYLSGGRDSRMTAGLWLSSGSDANVMTLGTLPEEARIAQELVERFRPREGQEVNHKITIPQGSEVTQSIEERVSLAFAMWDGDGAPTNIKRNLTVPNGRGALSIGGVGGEIMHGYYYSRPGAIEQGRAMDNPILLARRAYDNAVLTDICGPIVDGLFERSASLARSRGITDITASDHLYLTEKFRRWGNQALGSGSAILLSAPAYVRACFDLTPEDRVIKKFPEVIVDMVIPEWRGADFYKAVRDDSKSLMRRGLTTFETDREGFMAYFEGEQNWTKFLKEDGIKRMVEALPTEEALPVHESRANQAIWIENIYRNAQRLQQLVTDSDQKDPPITLSSLTRITDQPEEQEDSLEGYLRTGVLAPKRADKSFAQDIVDGEITLGDDTLDLTQPGTFSAGDTAELKSFLQLHTMRWVDTLLRADDQNTQFQDTWVAQFEKWWAGNHHAQPTDRIWNTVLTNQRTATIALGGELVQQLPLEMVEAHAHAAIGNLGSAATSTDFRFSAAALCLLFSQVDLPDLENEFHTHATTALNRFVRPGGGVFGKDNVESIHERGAWTRFFGIADPEEKFSTAAQKHLTENEYWVQSIRPDGALTEIGEAQPSIDELPASDELTYATTNARVGNPPVDVNFVDPNGMVSARTGWGETERALAEETHWTMLLGPVRGRDAHQDVGRITYSSQGVNWLVDPQDSVLAEADKHSVISRRDGKYRPLGAAELIFNREGDRVDDYMVRATVHNPVQWRRHAVFVRTSNYVIVEDRIIASRGAEVQQHWIINPEVEVELVRNVVRMTYGDKSATLTLFGTPTDAISIDTLKDPYGKPTATRVTVSFEGTSARLMAVIADELQSDRHKIARVPAPGNDLVFKVTDKNVDDYLVVTPRGSRLVPAELSIEEAIEATNDYLLNGDLDESQLLEQRRLTHEAIEGAKHRVWEAGGDQDTRRREIDFLASFANEQRITGLRDHGLGPAIIDIAGLDLQEKAAQVPAVANHRRSPLINWTGEEQNQSFYQLPLRTTRSTSHMPEAPLSDSFIWSIDFGVLTGSALIAPEPGETLVCYFHGATDRTRHATPRYERRRSFATIGEGPVMFFADPTLDLDSQNILTWFMGTDLINLHHLYAEMIDQAVRRFNSQRVVLVGNSGGGFAALQVASYLKGATVITVNGQTGLKQYQPRIAQPAIWASFGDQQKIDHQGVLERSEVIERYRAIGFDVQVLMHQNSGDDHHLNEHFVPFRDTYRAESATPDHLSEIVEYLGDGHLAPKTDDYVKLVQDRIAEMRDSGNHYEGLRY